jgi:hypothetical protein
MRAPRKIYELEEAERQLSAAIEDGSARRMEEFELGLLAGKLAALRWALGGTQGPIAPLVTRDFQSADGERARD